MHVVDVIRQVRDKQQISSNDLSEFIRGIASGDVADYQAAAFLMAVYLNGLSDQLTVALTLAMRDSGRIVDLSALHKPIIDKHSTGGVGDKISIPLAPLVAACGVPVPMIAGRGLGHTGGTLDKLEAIPGFRVDRTMEQFCAQVRDIGVSIMGQTHEIAPADQKLYALRDVTATIESIPLITASILSKKLAAGLNGLVMDVKVGRGAFMKDLPSARALAQSIVRVGNQAGMTTRALLTQMDTPLGTTIGNALEVKESVAILQGHGPKDTTELTLAFGVEMLVMGKVANTADQAMVMLKTAIASGAAFEKFRAMVHAQGGDVATIDNPDKLPRARYQTPICADQSGYICDLDALALGKVAMQLGAGRTKVADTIDPAVGIELGHTVGEYVGKEQPVLILHHNQSIPDELIHKTRAAIGMGSSAPAPLPLVHDRIA